MKIPKKLEKLHQYMTTDSHDVWDAARLVDTLVACLTYRNMGTPVLPLERPMYTLDRGDSTAIHFRRLLSALDGFNAPVESPSKLNYNLEALLSIMVDNSFSENLKEEVMKLLEDVSLVDVVKEQQYEIFSLSQRIKMVQCLLYYMYRAEDFMAMWRGVYCCPVSESIAMGYTTRVTNPNIDEAVSKVKNLICLLLGDRYQNVKISTRKLIRKYNYPTMGNQELGSMEYDEMYS